MNMKMHELQQHSAKQKIDQLLDKLREQAALEAEHIMEKYNKDRASDPDTPHPWQILDQQLDELFRAIK